MVLGAVVFFRFIQDLSTNSHDIWSQIGKWFRFDHAETGSRTKKLVVFWFEF